MSKQTKLDNLAKEIIEKKICPGLAKSATQLVFGDGNPDAEIVFIGEAPGKNEDLQGIPFVGAAGKFLNEMLEMIGLKRSDVYITNIVKYRPPDNRDPLPEEKTAFLPYLRAQLEIIKPKVVATLGRHSLNCFLPDLQIGAIHGQPKRIKLRLSSSQMADDSLPAGRQGSQLKSSGDQDADGVQGNNEKRANSTDGTKSESHKQLTQQSAAKLGSASGSARRQDKLVLVILPLFHPAAALYNGGLRQTLIDDFAKIPVILKKIRILKTF